MPFGHSVYHNRNRLYIPQLGRFAQRDPNQSALGVLAAGSMGRGTGVPGLAFDLEGMLGDGVNLHQYLGSNPLLARDPLGLFVVAALIPGPTDMASSVLTELVNEYSANLEWDTEWAGDWSYPDDAHSRTSSHWVDLAILRGMYQAFEIPLPDSLGGGVNPLDWFMSKENQSLSSAARVDRADSATTATPSELEATAAIGSTLQKKSEKDTLPASHTRRVDVPGYGDAIMFKHPKFGWMVKWPPGAVKYVVKVNHRMSPSSHSRHANKIF